MVEQRRILVIEDDDVIRQLLAEALGEDGYLVQTVGTYAAALNLLRTWLPQLILLDLRMPDMDAPTFRDQQRALGLAPDVPVIVVSASSRGSEEANAIEASALIPKPFDLAALLEQVQQTLKYG